MNRFLLALNVQSHFNPPAPLVEQIVRVAQQVPCVGTVFIGDEEKVPFSSRGMRAGPVSDSCAIPTENVFYMNGYTLPTELIGWLKENQASEVAIVGGFKDERILAAGMSIFDAGITPVLLPSLCYGNSWYEHTVTINLWERSIGKVYQSPIEWGVAA